MWVDFRAAENFGFLVGNEWFAVNKLSLNLSKKTISCYIPIV